MPNYLSADQFITLSWGTEESAPQWLCGFDPDTGTLLWRGGSLGSFTGEAASVGFIINSPINGGTWTGFAVNPARTRLYFVTSQGDLSITDETLAELTTIDLQPMVNGSFVKGEAIRVLPDGTLAVLVVADNSGVQLQILRMSAAGALVEVLDNLEPTPFAGGGDNNRMTLAMSPDGTTLAYLEASGVARGYVEPFAVPPGLECGDPDFLGGGFGRTAYLYDLDGEAPISSLTVTSRVDPHIVGDPVDKCGIALTDDDQLVIGATQGALSCDSINAVCPFADTNFGDGLAQRYATAGTLETTYPVDPGCVWMEDDDEVLTRDISSEWDVTVDWRKEFTVIVDAELSVPPDYRTHWQITGPSGQYLAVYSNPAGSPTGEDLYVSYNIGAGVITSNVYTLTPYARTRVRIQYKALDHELYFIVNCQVIQILSVDLSQADIDGSEETHGFVRGGPHGVSTERLMVAGVVVSRSALLSVADLTDAVGGHDWTAANGLEDYEATAGSEMSPIGLSPEATRFWYVKYVRQFRNSRLMFLERAVTSETARRFFLIDWQYWSSAGGADYLICRQIESLQFDEEAISATIPDEPEFTSGGTTGPLAWLELSLKTEPS